MIQDIERPLFTLFVEQMETLVERYRDNRGELERIDHELKFRKTRRAKKLHDKVLKLLAK